MIVEDSRPFEDTVDSVETSNEGDRLLFPVDRKSEDGRTSLDTDCTHQFADFSNVFKAFIGSSLIGLPFAIAKAGLVLGILGIIIIAFLTDHCCHLIVKCKKYAIDKICHQMEENGVDEFTIYKRREYLGVRMSYGQIGKAALGRVGSILVNTSIVITQYGFCVGYFIFFGNTLRSVIFSLMKFSSIPMTNLTMANVSALTTPFPTLVTTTHQNMTTFPTTVTTTSFLSTSNHSINSTTPVTGNLSYFDHLTSTMLTLNTTQIPIYAMAKNITNSTGILHVIKKVLKQPLSHDKLQSNNQWTFTLLLTMPLPLLILISFVKKIRKLAPVSVLANGAITSAFIATAIYIIVEFKSPHESLIYFNWATFPVFFGQVTAAFEGIGTVIPIEGSMAENRARYPCYLHISLTLLSMILGSFGVLGYVRYGHGVRQIVTENLAGSDIVIALRLLLFVGVLFTYPLQIYPVIQITESALFGRRGICRSKSGVYECANESRSVVNESPALSEVRISPWKRYITRSLLVISTAALAVIFRSQFALIGALTGSIGSSLLSYILPCLFHLNLRKGRLSRAIRFKDYFLMCFGVIGGITGMTVTIQVMVSSYNQHHKIKT